jgi:hypothetical protein
MNPDTLAPPLKELLDAVLDHLRQDEGARVLFEVSCPQCREMDGPCLNPDGTLFEDGFHNAKISATMHLIDFRDRSTL